MKETKNSKDWWESVPSEYRLRILDPDGWDRQNLQYSLYEELITKDEFKHRLSSSTIQCDISFFTAEW
jgi:hypothetical protein